jgi:hypothetical protein
MISSTLKNLNVPCWTRETPYVPFNQKKYGAEDICQNDALLRKKLPKKPNLTGPNVYSTTVGFTWTRAFVTGSTDEQN